MTAEIDFLPLHYRQRRERRRSNHRFYLFLAIIFGGCVMTEATFRNRLRNLELTRSHAAQQSQSIATKSEDNEALREGHGRLIRELEHWTRPLRMPKAADTLRSTLEVRPGSMVFERLEWDTGHHESPSLRIHGFVEDMADIVLFMTEVRSKENLPELEVKRAGSIDSTDDSSHQAFVIESSGSGSNS